MTSANAMEANSNSLAAAPWSKRLVALDQFRGYTVAGMFLVNFMGGYNVCPYLWRHSNNYCSYADTIMPQFFFAAGFALRLSFLKRQHQAGDWAAWARMIRRVLNLALVAILWYGYEELGAIRERLPTQGVLPVLYWLFKSPLFQTLLHIAVTSLWILPVVWTNWPIRVGYAVFSGLLHLALSYWFYFQWVHTDPGSIDGGPLGFLTWTIPTIAGTVACDYWFSTTDHRKLGPYLGWGIVLMAFGWVISCGTTIYDVPESQQALHPEQKYGDNPVIPSGEQFAAWNHRPAEPPFVPPPDLVHRKENYWMMSQQHGTLSYLIFSAGLSLVVFAFFVWLCQVQGVQIGVFRTLGVNALAGYILHAFSGQIVGKFLRPDSSSFEVYTGFAVYFLLVYLVLRLMEWRRIFIRM
ncbi:MAG: hypothetical protein U0872_09055 [Planctomycetaceae bacterium]